MPELEKKELVFATNNEHKLEEIRRLLSDKFHIKSLREIGCCDEIPETKETLEGNALQKADYIYTRYGIACFADDTGLEIDALNGEPGVYSARYAGESKNPEANMQQVLLKLKGETNRAAQFRTVIAYMSDQGTQLFEGVVKGVILETKKGSKGFGYDPIFLPEGEKLTFAELDMDTKNEISHRGRAVKKFISFLNPTKQ